MYSLVIFYSPPLLFRLAISHIPNRPPPYFMFSPLLKPTESN